MKFKLTNGTNSVLERFFCAPTGVDNWEEDVFGDDVLNPGESIDITIADGRTVCKYDMRFEFEEGSNLATTEDTQDFASWAATPSTNNPSPKPAFASSEKTGFSFRLTSALVTPLGSAYQRMKRHAG